MTTFSDRRQTVASMVEVAETALKHALAINTFPPDKVAFLDIENPPGQSEFTFVRYQDGSLDIADEANGHRVTISAARQVAAPTTDKDLTLIHTRMKAAVERLGGLLSTSPKSVTALLGDSLDDLCSK